MSISPVRHRGRTAPGRIDGRSGAPRRRASDRPSPAGRLRSTTPAGRDLRLEIQAARALAIAAVVLYHLFPTTLSGGFVGVDVFFVISGYLITAHIARPMAAGTFRFRDFFVRRAWRLLPAALTVLAASLLLTVVFVPRTLWRDFAGQVAASALYVENWVLAGNSVDYSALDPDSSIVQHFWSLSTEEQFYIGWPLVLWACTLFALRRRPVRTTAVAIRRRRLTKAFAVGLGAVFVLSLATSVVETAHSPAAYFLTTTRAWEFAVGGLLWLALQHVRLTDVAAGIASWTGLTAIVVTLVTFDASTPFPGATALLPVVGTALVIAGGMPGVRWGPASLFRARPVQWLGDVSYSLYLWHWPLLVVVPYALRLGSGSATPLWAKAVVLVVALGLAQVTRRRIELPLIAFSALRMRSRRPPYLGTLVLGTVGMLVIASPATVVVGSVVREQQHVVAAPSSTARADGSLSVTPCFGAAAMRSGAHCADVDADDLTPTAVQAATDDFADQEGAGCQVQGDDTTVTTCQIGDPDGDVRLALVGDSHAANWAPALSLIAKAHHWELTTYLHSGCPLTAAEITASCDTWKADVLQRLQGERYDAVFVAAMSRSPWPTALIHSASALTPAVRDASAAAYSTVWQQLQQAGSTVVALRDNPDASIGGTPDVPSCVAQHGSGPECAFPESRGLLDDPVARAARTTPGVDLVDATDLFCADGTCPAVIGGVVVYRQIQHVTRTYSRSMAPLLEPEIARAVTAATG